MKTLVPLSHTCLFSEKIDKLKLNILRPYFNNATFSSKIKCSSIERLKWEEVCCLNIRVYVLLVFHKENLLKVGVIYAQALAEEK